ncbi:MAG: flagellar biosynthetic protein FliR [Pseudomonadota bacterium]
MTPAELVGQPAHQLLALHVSVRAFAAAAATPGLDSPVLPGGSRVVLGAVLAAVFVGALDPSSAQASPQSLVLSLAGELCLGALLGLALVLPIHALQGAGEVVGSAMGLGFATAVDAAVEGQETMMARLYGAIAALAFLGADGPSVVLRALGLSLVHAPPGQVQLGSLLDPVRILGSQFFDILVRVAAAPVLAVLLAQLVVGLIGRASPALNVFAIGFAITLTAGLLAVGLSMPATLNLLTSELWRSTRWLELLLAGSVR